MVNAKDLINKQLEREKKKFVTFDKIYNKIEKKIVSASSTDFYYIWYEIPQYIIGQPFYKYVDCSEYIINKLKKCNFKIEKYDPNILLISWFPST